MLTRNRSQFNREVGQLDSLAKELHLEKRIAFYCETEGFVGLNKNVLKAAKGVIEKHFPSQLPAKDLLERMLVLEGELISSSYFGFESFDSEIDLYLKDLRLL